ncbi:MAG TPA: STAS domain-containing protein [Tepidisphaeraceae bacterium]|nr:STAS domain-containing protein [Tepidisphaeraceae bacterium]
METRIPQADAGVAGVEGHAMVAADDFTRRIEPRTNCLGFREADQLARTVIRSIRQGSLILLDLRHVQQVMTSGLARLVQLRRELRERGVDLRLDGLHGQPAGAWELHRLDRALPIAH